MKRDIVVLLLLILALTAVGEYAAATLDFYPAAHSDKGEEIRDAFMILTYMAVPVCAIVIAVLAYTLAARRGRGPDDDGQPIQGKGAVPAAWFAVTSGLTLLVMIYPGLTSLGNVVDNPTNPELTVKVEGVQWTWLVSYPDQKVERVSQLVLPVDRQVRFEMSSLDVLHSFWIPAFAMKLDAVPGKTTVVSLTPEQIGSYETDDLLRLQCAELCGLSHSKMMIPVSVVSQDDFEKWVAEKQVKTTPAPTAGPGGSSAPTVSLTLTARNLAFDKQSLEAPAGQAFDIEFENADTGTMHNFSIYTDDSATKSLYTGQLFSSGTQTENVPALEAGTYFFRCDVHPTTMTGDLVVQ
jgi:cytochrome c oxidase subunit 2